MGLMKPVDDEPVFTIVKPFVWLIGAPRQVQRVFLTRSFRVLALSIAIVVMSSVDLYLTILYITHSGMNEMNPLARAMMEYQSPSILAVWKMGTVVLSVGILLLIRKQRSAECGAWVGCLVLGWLMTHWVGFIDDNAKLNLEIAHALNRDNPNWILMTTSADPAIAPRRVIVD